MHRYKIKTQELKSGFLISVYEGEKLLLEMLEKYLQIGINEAKKRTKELLELEEETSNEL